MTRIVELSNGPWSLKLLPELGGALAQLQLKRGEQVFDLLRPAVVDIEQLLKPAPMAMSNFALVPYSNRIRDNRFTFGGKRQRAASEDSEHLHGLHGHGWVGAWEVVVKSGSAVELVFHYPGNDFQWPYVATQGYELLDDHSVRMRLSLGNRGKTPMPAGIGFHPYFPRTPQAQLSAQVSGVWLGDSAAGGDMLPSRTAEVPEQMCFRQNRAVAELCLDHCFHGWDGLAQVVWPERELALEMRADPVFSHLVVYVPPKRDFFCVEPVTNANDGFNLHAKGCQQANVQVLEPEQTLEGEVTLRVVR